MISRSMILESMYEVIKDSTEWGVSCEDGSYGNYVDGVMAMTDKMLDKNSPRTEMFKNAINSSEESECELGVIDEGISPYVAHVKGYTTE